MEKSLRTLIYIALCIFPLYFVYGNIHGNSQMDNRRLQYNLVNELPDIYIHPTSEKIGVTWSNGHVWDKPLIQKFYSLLPADDFFVVIDLGAQTGCFSLLAKYFPNSAWHSFEPIQEAATTLKENLVLNDIHNVSVYQTAVANFSGKVTLSMPPMNDLGLATIGSNITRFVPTMVREVPCIDLDTFITEHKIERVHFMKIDTEGSELSILRGARKMIMRDHPIIVMEYNETNMRQCGVLKQDIDNFLTEMGYEWKPISSDDVLCTPITS